jgi:hypothetical protein
MLKACLVWPIYPELLARASTSSSNNLGDWIEAENRFNPLPPMPSRYQLFRSASLGGPVHFGLID